MKRILIIAMILTACAAQYGNAETIRLSGTDISLELLAATAATALQDSITAMHSKLETKAKVSKDTLTVIHSKLETRTNGVKDTLTALHAKLETRTNGAKDTLTALHSKLETRHKTLADTLTGIHSKLETRTNGVIDTLTALHSKLETKSKAAIDSIAGEHSNLLSYIKTARDTTTATHSNLLVSVGAAKDTLTDVHEKIELLDAMLDTIKGATGVLYEQADAPVNITAIADSGITVLNLRAATTRYVVRNLRLKSVDPGANTVTITLWEFINDAFIAVDTFAITTSNYTNYFSLQDMFGEPQLYGDNIMIMAQSDAGSYAITGQYSYAKTGN